MGESIQYYSIVSLGAKLRSIAEPKDSPIWREIDNGELPLNVDEFDPLGGRALKFFIWKVNWPPISNALTGEKAKEISKSRFPVFPNFLGLVLGCIEAKFCK